MPEKDGIEVIGELRRNHPDAKVIAISGGDSLGEISLFLESAELSGAMRTLAKPFKEAQLLRVVEELLTSARNESADQQ